MTDGSPYADWVGRVVEGEDSVPAQTARALAAALGMDAAARAAAEIAPEGRLPPLWHWLAFLPEAPMAALAPDGREAQGELLPPAPHARRVLAGARLRLHGELLIGETLHRRSEILAVAGRAGPEGDATLVSVAHEISTARGLAVSETQELLLLPRPGRFPPLAVDAPPASPDWSEPMELDGALLFRFAAATFDAQRLHYDLAYARDAAGYPGLLAQGRLQAILLLEAARRRRGGAWPAAFAFRGLRPLVAGAPARLVAGPESGGGQDAATLDAEGGLCLQARITWEA
ncbi:MaoC family dehydratase N-terminal domain-containing protein [Amaricoccus sp.]|uniref:FAS1-like dehydratase domain-containing protein n=1 Tax=Amaricoccus sp. TaxID=1872485 RepID=UPI001B5DC2A5|nr:MaoC family dehydratase N-terminal domain-containing protein [Amaricoccus sp.]MBP7001141.1 MaoC family dehydratase N-terminal domain-containing protein [Amaricoccus sp.]